MNPSTRDNPTDNSTRSRFSDACLASILQISGEAIVIVSPTGLIEQWNPSAAQLYGYTAEEMLGRPMTLLTPAEHFNEQLDILAYVNAGGTVHLDTVWVAKGGRLIDIKLAMTPIVDAQQRVVGITALTTDITSRKRVEATLNENEAWAGLAIQVARLGTWRWTPARDEVLADARCREICGFDPKAHLRLDMTLQLIHPDDRSRVSNALTRAMQLNGSGHYTEEFRFVHPDGSIHWVLSRGRTVFVQEANLKWVSQGRRDSRAAIERQPSAYILGTILDVTEFMQVEQALRQGTPHWR